MSDKVRKLLERVRTEPATEVLLEEVHQLKERAIREQMMDVAADLRAAERYLQVGIQLADDLKRFGFSIAVKEHKVLLDPPISIFHVTVTRKIGEGEGIWPESVPSKESLKWFMQGLKILAPSGLLPEPRELPNLPLLTSDIPT